VAAGEEVLLPGPGKRGLGGFLTSVRDAATRVVDDTTKELSKGLDKLGKEVISAARNPFAGGGSRVAQRRPPPLAAVFSNAPAPDSPVAGHDRPIQRYAHPPTCALMTYLSTSAQEISFIFVAQSSVNKPSNQLFLINFAAGHRMYDMQ
jgi:hypothetical protein